MITDVMETTCTMCISVEVDFKNKWREYLKKTGKAQKDIFEEIMQNTDKFCNNFYEKPDNPISCEKVPLGISLKLKDRMKIREGIDDKRNIGITLKDFMTGYMNIYPAE